MLSTRLWIGTLLILFVLGVLVVDQWLAPWYPVWYALILTLMMLTCFELCRVLQPNGAVPRWLCYAALALLATSNWPAHLPGIGRVESDPWHWVLATYLAMIFVILLWALIKFERGAEGVSNPLIRLALTLFVLTYLGLLPCFLIQVRWLTSTGADGARQQALLAMALVIFVPKMADVGAYFVGKWLGKHSMTPRLSPRKTWEGLAGGLLFAVATSMLITSSGKVLSGSLLKGAAFGLTVGIVGAMGDLVASFLKRAGQQKDASKVVPGYGGVLDVVDSIVLSAPVSYLWLTALPA